MEDIMWTHIRCLTYSENNELAIFDVHKLFRDMADEEIIEVPTFDSIVDAHNWKRRLDDTQTKQLLNDIIILASLNETLPTTFIKRGSDWDKLYPKLAEIVSKKLLLLKDDEKFDISKLKNRDYIGNVKNYKNFRDRILNNDIIGTGLGHEMYFFVPVNKVDLKTADDVINGLVVPDYNGALEMDNVGVDNDVVEQVKQASRSQQQQKKNKVIELGGDSIKKIGDKLGEPSVEKKLNRVVNEIAKNRNLMSLSEEQLKKVLMYEMGFDAGDADAIIKLVISRRAELLANKELKREQLTDVDVEKLQEQSQRDFERKLHDQNLRYLLPAMLEKRDRLVVNRLNPELLKCGY